MFISGFAAGAWATNCYVVATATGEPCIIIDPGQDSIDRVHEIIREHHLTPAAVLLTHGHMDHVWSVAPVERDFGIPAYIHRDDRYRLVDPAGSSMAAAREQLLSMTKDSLELTEPSDIRVWEESESITIAGIDLDIRHAPGHTEGSVVFEVGATPQEAQIQRLLFSGDVLFQGSIGRTDLPGGDGKAMNASLRHVIWPLPDDMTVLPGHGDRTTIGQERLTNPFLRAASAEGVVDAPQRGW